MVSNSTGVVVHLTVHTLPILEFNGWAALAPAMYLCVCCARVCVGYLCPKAANIFGIEFVRFKVRDMDSQQVLFEIAKPEDAEEGEVEDNGGEVEGKEGAEGEEDTERFIRYEFPPQVLRLKTLGAT